MNENKEIKDYIDYPADVKKYDTSKLPIRQKFFFTVLLNLASRAALRLTVKKGYKIEKINMEGLEPPYLLLSNHMQFTDFLLKYKATFPHRVHTVATLEGYYKKPWLVEQIGSICKRKFTTDISLIRSCAKVLREYKDVLCIYPEARYTPIGTCSEIPEVIGKLAKKNKVPVVVIIHHGNYLRAPFWDFRRKKAVPLYTTVKQILTAEQVEQMSADEINAKIREEMQYNEYKWQKDNNIRITEDYRAEGLHKVLYQCPHCMTESKMNSKGIHLFCEECGKKWELTELGELKALEGETEFAHIPDWFEWERANVRKEIESGSYSFEDDVRVYTLPGAMKYYYMGDAKVRHNPEEGFVLEGSYNGEPYRVQRSVKSLYSLHVEYDYCHIEPIDCFDISTQHDSFFCYPSKPNVITKLCFATEEMFKIANEKKEKIKA